MKRPNVSNMIRRWRESKIANSDWEVNDAASRGRTLLSAPAHAPILAPYGRELCAGFAAFLRRNPKAGQTDHLARYRSFHRAPARAGPGGDDDQPAIACHQAVFRLSGGRNRAARGQPGKAFAFLEARPTAAKETQWSAGQTVVCGDQQSHGSRLVFVDAALRAARLGSGAVETQRYRLATESAVDTARKGSQRPLRVPVG